MEFRGIWQDVRVCGNRIYLILMHGEFCSTDIRFTALTLLEDEIWDDEWKKRRYAPRKKHYPMLNLIRYFNSFLKRRR